VRYGPATPSSCRRALTPREFVNFAGRGDAWTRVRAQYGAKVDVLLGNGGRDHLMGNSGRDWLVGHAGVDLCVGGAGVERAVICELIS